MIRPGQLFFAIWILCGAANFVGCSKPSTPAAEPPTGRDVSLSENPAPKTPPAPPSNDPYLKAVANHPTLADALDSLNAEYAFDGEGQLSRLALDDIAITDEAMPALAKHSELRALYLFNTLISDTGLAELKALKHLDILVLTGSPVSPEAVEALQTALPNCWISP